MLGALSLKWKWKQRREAAGSRSTSRTWSSAATSTWSGKSSAATSTSNRGSCRCGKASTRSVPRTWSPTSTRTRSASPPCSAPPSPATKTTSSASTSCCSRSRRSGELDVPLHVDAASGGFVWPFLYPRLRVGLPARAGALDQRLRPQVRARLPGHRLARLPREERPRRGPRLLRELPGQDRRHLHPQLLDRRLDGAGPVLQLRPLRPRGLRLRDEGDGAERPGAGREAGGERPLRADRRRRGAAAAGRLQARRGQELRRVRRLLAALGRARLDAARLHDAAQRRRREGDAGAGQADPRAARRSTASPTTSPRPAPRSRRRAGPTPPSARR